MGVLLPNITSVVAVAIVFTQLFARDFGLVNWLLGFVGVDRSTGRQHRWSSWLAIAVDGRLALDRLQRADLPGRDAGDPADLYEAAAIDGASQLAAVLAHHRADAAADHHLRQPSISTIGGLQLFTEPLLFTSGANAISGGTTASSRR